MDLFFTPVEFRPFSNGIFDLLFVQQLVKLQPSEKNISTGNVSDSRYR